MTTGPADSFKELILFLTTAGVVVVLPTAMISPISPVQTIRVLRTDFDMMRPALECPRVRGHAPCAHILLVNGKQRVSRDTSRT